MAPTKDSRRRSPAKKERSRPQGKLKPYQINSQIPLKDRVIVPFANEHDVIFGRSVTSTHPWKLCIISYSSLTSIHDIFLCCVVNRGTCLSSLPGCLLFRKVCWLRKKKYINANVCDKQGVAQECLDYMRNIGGRFLEYIVIRNREQLAFVPEPRVMEKACQTLREQKHKQPEGFSAFVAERKSILKKYKTQKPRRINIHVHEQEKWSYYCSGTEEEETTVEEETEESGDEEDDGYDMIVDEDSAEAPEDSRRSLRFRQTKNPTYADQETESEEEEDSTAVGEEQEQEEEEPAVDEAPPKDEDEDQPDEERKEKTSTSRRKSTKGTKAKAKRAKKRGRPAGQKKKVKTSDPMRRLLQTHGPFSNLVRQVCSARSNEAAIEPSETKSGDSNDSIKHALLEENNESSETGAEMGEAKVLIVKSNNKVLLTREYSSASDHSKDNDETEEPTPQVIQSGTLYRKAALNACAAISNLSRCIPRANRRTVRSIPSNRDNGKFKKSMKVATAAKPQRKPVRVKTEPSAARIDFLKEKAKAQVRDENGLFVKNRPVDIKNSRRIGSSLKAQARARDENGMFVTKSAAAPKDLELLVKEACDAVHIEAVGHQDSLDSSDMGQKTTGVGETRVHGNLNGSSTEESRTVTKHRLSTLGKVPRTKRAQDPADGKGAGSLKEDTPAEEGFAYKISIPSPLVRSSKKPLVDDDDDDDDESQGTELEAHIPPSFRPFSSGIFSVVDGGNQQELVDTNKDDIPPPPYALAFQTSKTWDGAPSVGALECKEEIMEKPLLTHSFSGLHVEPPSLNAQHSLDLRGGDKEDGRAGLHRAFSGMVVEPPGLNAQHSLAYGILAGETGASQEPPLPPQGLKRGASDCGDDLMGGNFDSEAAKFISARS